MKALQRLLSAGVCGCKAVKQFMVESGPKQLAFVIQVGTSRE
ncbi:MAG: hypothetical protein ACREP9_01025 [Candidatus Dormibacteraceae bacterium]